MSQQRIALITGGSRGIGLEVGKELASKGHKVILVARDYERLEIEKAKLDSKGFVSDIFAIDFLQSNSIDKLEKFLLKKELNPTILINGLGGGFGSVHFDPLTKFEEVMRLNFFVAHELTKLVLTSAARQNWGRFIYFGTMAINHKSASAPYIAAKAALIEYMKTISKELGKTNQNLMAAAVSPGAISVPGKYLNKIEKEDPKTLAQFIQETKIPIARLGTTKEIAEVVSFLCDEQTRYLHGCNIQIDGGASN